MLVGLSRPHPGFLARTPVVLFFIELGTCISLAAPTGDLAAKNRKLVSKHHDLEFLELTRAQPQCRNRQHTPKQQIQQRHDQPAASPPESEEANSTIANPAPTPTLGARWIYVPHGVAEIPAPRALQQRFRAKHGCPVNNEGGSQPSEPAEVGDLRPG